MTPEEVGHAFDRFWHADASRLRSGAGLGLAIVRGVVLVHAGDVTLESDPVTGNRVRATVSRGEANGSESDVLAVSHVE
jgi:signal transduction histidine kinase